MQEQNSVSLFDGVAIKCPFDKCSGTAPNSQRIAVASPSKRKRTKKKQNLTSKSQSKYCDIRALFSKVSTTSIKNYTKVINDLDIENDTPTRIINLLVEISLANRMVKKKCYFCQYILYNNCSILQRRELKQIQSIAAWLDETPHLPDIDLINKDSELLLKNANSMSDSKFSSGNENNIFQKDKKENEIAKNLGFELNFLNENNLAEIDKIISVSNELNADENADVVDTQNIQFDIVKKYDNNPQELKKTLEYFGLSCIEDLYTKSNDEGTECESDSTVIYSPYHPTQFVESVFGDSKSDLEVNICNDEKSLRKRQNESDGEGPMYKSRKLTNKVTRRCIASSTSNSSRSSLHNANTNKDGDVISNLEHETDIHNSGELLIERHSESDDEGPMHRSRKSTNKVMKRYIASSISNSSSFSSHNANTNNAGYVEIIISNENNTIQKDEKENEIAKKFDLESELNFLNENNLAEIDKIISFINKVNADENADVVKTQDVQFDIVKKYDNNPQELKKTLECFEWSCIEEFYTGSDDEGTEYESDSTVIYSPYHPTQFVESVCNDSKSNLEVNICNDEKSLRNRHNESDDDGPVYKSRISTKKVMKKCIASSTSNSSRSSPHNANTNKDGDVISNLEHETDMRDSGELLIQRHNESDDEGPMYKSWKSTNKVKKRYIASSTSNSSRSSPHNANTNKDGDVEIINISNLEHETDMRHSGELLIQRHNESDDEGPMYKSRKSTKKVTKRYIASSISNGSRSSPHNANTNKDGDVEIINISNLEHETDMRDSGELLIQRHNELDDEGPMYKSRKSTNKVVKRYIASSTSNGSRSSPHNANTNKDGDVEIINISNLEHETDMRHSGELPIQRHNESDDDGPMYKSRKSTKKVMKRYIASSTSNSSRSSPHNANTNKDGDVEIINISNLEHKTDMRHSGELLIQRINELDDEGPMYKSRKSANKVKKRYVASSTSNSSRSSPHNANTNKDGDVEIINISKLKHETDMRHSGELPIQRHNESDDDGPMYKSRKSTKKVMKRYIASSTSNSSRSSPHNANTNKDGDVEIINISNLEHETDMRHSGELFIQRHNESHDEGPKYKSRKSTKKVMKRYIASSTSNSSRSSPHNANTNRDGDVEIINISNLEHETDMRHSGELLIQRHNELDDEGPMCKSRKSTKKVKKRYIASSTSNSSRSSPHNANTNKDGDVINNLEHETDMRDSGELPIQRHNESDDEGPMYKSRKSTKKVRKRYIASSTSNSSRSSPHNANTNKDGDTEIINISNLEHETDMRDSGKLLIQRHNELDDEGPMCKSRKSTKKVKKRYIASSTSNSSRSSPHNANTNKDGDVINNLEHETDMRDSGELPIQRHNESDDEGPMYKSRKSTKKVRKRYIASSTSNSSRSSPHNANTNKDGDVEIINISNLEHETDMRDSGELLIQRHNESDDEGPIYKSRKSTDKVMKRYIASSTSNSSRSSPHNANTNKDRDVEIINISNLEHETDMRDSGELLIQRHNESDDEGPIYKSRKSTDKVMKRYIASSTSNSSRSSPHNANTNKDRDVEIINISNLEHKTDMRHSGELLIQRHNELDDEGPMYKSRKSTNKVKKRYIASSTSNSSRSSPHNANTNKDGDVEIINISNLEHETDMCDSGELLIQRHNESDDEGPMYKSRKSTKKVMKRYIASSTSNSSRSSPHNANTNKDGDVEIINISNLEHETDMRHSGELLIQRHNELDDEGPMCKSRKSTKKVKKRYIASSTSNSSRSSPHNANTNKDGDVEIINISNLEHETDMRDSGELLIQRHNESDDEGPIYKSRKSTNKVMKRYIASSTSNSSRSSPHNANTKKAGDVEIINISNLEHKTDMRHSGELLIQRHNELDDEGPMYKSRKSTNKVKKRYIASSTSNSSRSSPHNANTNKDGDVEIINISNLEHETDMCDSAELLIQRHNESDDEGPIYKSRKSTNKVMKSYIASSTSNSRQSSLYSANTNKDGDVEIINISNLEHETDMRDSGELLIERNNESNDKYESEDIMILSPNIPFEKLTSFVISDSESDSDNNIDLHSNGKFLKEPHNESNGEGPMYTQPTEKNITSDSNTNNVEVLETNIAIGDYVRNLKNIDINTNSKLQDQNNASDNEGQVIKSVNNKMPAIATSNSTINLPYDDEDDVQVIETNISTVIISDTDSDSDSITDKSDSKETNNPANKEIQTSVIDSDSDFEMSGGWMDQFEYFRY